MKYFYIEPEVAGGHGEHTIADRSTHPPRIQRLHYEFEGWPDDALLTSFPCLIATEEAAEALTVASVTGIEIASVEISTSDFYQKIEQELHPDRKLPPFVWLRVTGIAGKDDFGVADDYRFVVSERVLTILRPLGLNNADIEPFL